MKGFILFLVTPFIVTSAIAESSYNSGDVNIEPDDIGGPDAYGYSWIDNDSAGGPVYDWIDITAYGTRVFGLADDNNVGPFPIGFEFPYYWYMVDHLWIYSNGHISFSSNANYDHPFSGIPFSGLPNDLVAILVGDLDFTQGNGECWYYTNGLDTFIVSYLHVTEWADTTASHTFQCILSAADSTIRFQYGPNSGDFRDPANQHRCVIGIEDCSGTIGSEYMHDLQPYYRLWHDSLAIEFHPEPDSGFHIHDIAVKNGLNETSGAEFMPLNEPYSLKVQLENVGNQSEDFSVRCRVRRGFTTVYDETETFSGIEPGVIMWHDFPQAFIPDQASSHRVYFDMYMTGDMCAYNNSKMVELVSYQLPQVVRYCDDIPETGRIVDGDSAGFAVGFQIPEGIEILSAAFYVSHFYANSDANIKILSDDGSGKPDELNPLAIEPVNVLATGWVSADLSFYDLLLTRNRMFYVAVTTNDTSGFLFGMDQSPPLSNRGWIYYNDEILPDFYRFHMDIMFKMSASPWSEGGCPYVVGDVNNDGNSNGIDVIYSVNFFKGGPAPVDTCECLGHDYIETADVDNSCSFNALDITRMINYYKGESYLDPCGDCLPPE
jgi:hypothetical protein